MKQYEVWMESHSATGDSSEAKTFAEACAVWNREKGHPGYFDPERLTYWGCRFFDNEHNARKSFG